MKPRYINGPTGRVRVSSGVGLHSIPNHHLAPGSPAHHRPSGSAAFTLLELMISSSLIALILAAAALCLRAAVSGQTMIDTRGDALQTARVAMSLMAADLRAAYPIAHDLEFIGMRRTLDGMAADNVDFATLNYSPRGPEESDVCVTSYYLDRDTETGTLRLLRRRNPVPIVEPDADPLAGGRREEIAEGIRGLRLEYYDGLYWYDEWGDPRGRGRHSKSPLAAANLTGLPEAARITLSVEPDLRARRSRVESGEPEPPLILQTVVRLNLAGMVATGAAGSSGRQESGETDGVMPAASGGVN
jgi:type II secretory pathway pseudopilin PulG